MNPGPKSHKLVLMTPDAVGGVWNYCVRLAEALADYQVEIALATMGPAPNEHQRQEIRRLANVRLHESTFKLGWMQNPWEDVDRAGRWLLDLEDQLQPDLIHLNGYAHAALPWSSPVLVVAHSCVCSWFQSVRGCEPTPEWDEYRRRVRQGLQHADLVMGPTISALERLSRYYGAFRSGGPIYNGCEPAEGFSPRTDELVFCAGRLWDPAKNIATLDRAAQGIRPPVFAAGTTTGPDQQWIELKNIRSLGYLDQAALHGWYRRAAVFVLPSLYEPFGLTALEAGLAGCALVLSDIPSLREVWGDAAVFVPAQDDHALALAVNRLIEDVPFRREYGRRAEHQARTYTPARMAAGYYRSYSNLICKQASTLAGAL
ncbi:MAG: glycosyltransferase family 4 protein [Planctomycetes bacterium]|nr:glycosyltransferase family 4 protein [Planctomycetota bacterium]